MYTFNFKSIIRNENIIKMEIVFFSFFSEKKYNNMLGKTYFLDCLKYSDDVFIHGICC